MSKEENSNDNGEDAKKWEERRRKLAEAEDVAGLRALAREIEACNPRGRNAAIGHAAEGNALGYEKKYEEALACYGKAIGCDPEYAEAYSGKGVELLMLSRKEEALACYDKAIKCDQLLAEAYNGKGVVLSHLGRHEESLACYDKAIECDPKDAAAYSNKGIVLSDLGRKVEALACYDKAIECDPKDATAYRNKGIELSDLGRKEEALACYDKAIECDSKYTPAYYNKGNVLFDLGREKEAIVCYDEASKLVPEVSSFFGYRKSEVLESLDRKEDAKEAYLQAIEDDPVYKDIYQRLAGGNFSDASEALRKLWIAQHSLLWELRADEKEQFPDGIAHYTSISTFDRLIGVIAEKDTEKNKKKVSPLKLFSVSTANDPLEGKVLQSFLDCPKETPKEERMIALQTSFSKRVDHLTQFRLYGKNQKQEEGKGLCLVFRPEFFADGSAKPEIAMSTRSGQPEKELVLPRKHHLYWVLYYNSKGKKKKFYYTPAQCEVAILMEETKGTDSPDEAGDKSKTLEEIGKALEEVKDSYKEVPKTDLETAWHLLIYLRHLVKDAAFMDEQEARILRLCEYGDENVEILCAERGLLAVNYLPVISDGVYLKEVIGGPKVMDFEKQSVKWKHVIAQNCPASAKCIDFWKSDLPLA